MASDRRIYALKRIELPRGEPAAAAGFEQEIALLASLRGRHNIIQLIDAEVLRPERLIYMVLEAGEIDLAELLKRREAVRTEPAGRWDAAGENFLRLYWQQMLEAVHSIHEARIVHSDLKPANFLVVQGQLKLIDFGIAKAIQGDTTNIERESQVGTLNYMSPEAIRGAGPAARPGPGGALFKLGRPSDVWSLGCILYQMVYGRTPFHHLVNMFAKVHAITEPSHAIAFSPPHPNVALMDCMRRCLERDPAARITIPELLQHPFLRPAAPPITAGDLQAVLARVATAKLRPGLTAATVCQEILQMLAAGKPMDLAQFLDEGPAAAAGLQGA